MTSNNAKYRWLHIAIWLGAVPFLIWRFQSRGLWPDFSLAAYVLTAYHAAMLVIHYPGPGNRWYMKVVALAIIAHCALLSAFAIGAVAILAAKIKPPTMLFLGLVGLALVMESRL